ncbi:MAG: response regulator transcription factor [Rhodospirillales bacterium]|nr:response regulator transcription factor [Rhodospirillales bacterium]
MTADLPHILVVDDDDRLRDLLRQYLTENGFIVTVANSAGDARTRLNSLAFDLIVLDLMMPGETGLEFAADFRKSNNTPILMLTAMAETSDRITGLEHGADDYLTKPFEPRELLLRIQSILRRVPEESAQEDLTMGECVFSPARAELFRSGNRIHLTEVESALLVALAKQPGAILSREELIDTTGAAGTDRAVDVQVTRLRRKIERDPRMPRYLQTVRGRGYVLRPD